MSRLKRIEEAVASLKKAVDQLFPDGTVRYDTMDSGTFNYVLPGETRSFNQGTSATEVGDSFDMAGEEKEDPELPENVRAAILRKAEELINGDRAQTYGPIEISFGRHADIWNAQGYRRHVQVEGQPPGITRSVKLDAIDAVMILEGLKMSHAVGNHGSHIDDWIDKAGYSAIGAELSENQRAEAESDEVAHS